MLCALVFASQLLESPTRAARIALMPDILPADVYPTGVAVNHLTSQIMTLGGFAAGGVVVGLLGPEPSILIDAATFAAAALLTMLTLRRRPGAAAASKESWLSATGAGFHLITASPVLRGLLGLALLAAFHVIPEGVAVPYAASLGLGSAEAGFLMAAIPVGNVIGVVLLTRFVPVDKRLTLMGPMALATALPLAVMVIAPPYPVILVLWTLSGALSAYQVSANAEFVRVVPADRRGQAVGLASSALVAVQGLGILAGGLIVEWTSPANGVALAGAAGLLAALPLAWSWHKAGTSAAGAR